MIPTGKKPHPKLRACPFIADDRISGNHCISPGWRKRPSRHDLRWRDDTDARRNDGYGPVSAFSRQFASEPL
jgi:hypothetical protein